MDYGDLEVRAAADLLAYLGTSPIATAGRRDGLLAVATGTFSNTENGVVCDREPEPDAVAPIVERFRDRGLPASWICRTGPASDRLRAALVACGCREEASGVAMGAALGSPPPPAPPPGVVVERVDGPGGLSAWLSLAAACGWYGEAGERDAAERLLASLPLDRGPLRHWVARRSGRSIGFATAFFTRETVALVHLGVVEDERRRGVGASLAGARLAEARARRCRHAVLGPSPDGAELYRNLGFDHAPVARGRWFYLPLSPAPPPA